MINREDLKSGTRPEVGNRILVTEKETFEGYQIMDYKGVVWGISMRAKDIVQDSLMGCKDITGGELTSYTELSDEVRQRAWDRMLTSARRIKANAIINFRFEITPVMYGSSRTSEVIAYGNAVVIEPIKNYVPTGGIGNILVEFVDGYLKNVSDGAPNTTVSKKAQIIKINNAYYAVCPECELKYKIIKDENGHVKVPGLTDVDPYEEGMQMYCSRCGKKFTIPEE